MDKRYAIVAVAVSVVAPPTIACAGIGSSATGNDYGGGYYGYDTDGGDYYIDSGGADTSPPSPAYLGSVSFIDSREGG